MQQLIFSIRVRCDPDDTRTITKSEAKAILRGAFNGAFRGGRQARDVTLWDSQNHCIAHWDHDPQPYRKQTIASCFNHPLGR